MSEADAPQDASGAVPIIDRTELPEGRLVMDVQRSDGVLVHSLTGHAVCAMDRHRWIESEKAGRDLGPSACRDWVDRYWSGFVRHKLMEHLYGWRYWGAFESADYGMLARTSVEHHVPGRTLRKVASLIAHGGENLDVIRWAMQAGEAIEPILWVLDRIDINAKRKRLLADHIRLFLP